MHSNRGYIPPHLELLKTLWDIYSCPCLSFVVKLISTSCTRIEDILGFKSRYLVFIGCNAREISIRPKSFKWIKVAPYFLASPSSFFVVQAFTFVDFLQYNSASQCRDLWVKGADRFMFFFLNVPFTCVSGSLQNDHWCCPFFTITYNRWFCDP